MNKIVLKIAIVTAVSISAVSAFAASQVTTTVIGGGTFAPSNNVGLWCSASTTAYNAVSGHLQGDRIMGSGNASPNIVYKAKAKGTAVVAGDCPASTTDFSSWSAVGTL